MSAFSDLMLEAKALGVLELRFDVDLESYKGIDLDTVQRWTVKGCPVDIPHVAAGRTGEEALRELVQFLKKTGDVDAAG